MNSSEPIVLEFYNTNSTKARNVIIFNAFESAGVVDGIKKPTNYGMNADIIVSNLGGGVDYGTFLESVKSQPIQFNKVYLQSSNTTQITKSMNFIYADSFGASKQYLFFPKLDPLQNQSSVLMLDYEMTVNGYSSVRFALEPLTTINISFYLTKQFNLANEIIGEAAIQKYRFRSISQMSV